MSRPGKGPPDEDQRDLVLSELDRCVLVEAAAGTGKTTCIIGRMVELLRTGHCPDIRNLVAVTFTRKAAAELRARFQVALESAVRTAEGEEAERLSSALDSIAQCVIGTIHSFCARLLRERPVEADIDPGFEEIDEDADAVLRREVWDEFCATLLSAGDSDTIAALDGLDPSDLEGAFNNYITYPDVDRWPVPAQRDLSREVEAAACALEDYAAHMKALAPDLPRLYGNDKLIPRYRAIPRAVSHYDDLRSAPQLMELLKEQFDFRSGEVQKEWAKDGRFSAADAKREARRWNDFRETVVKPTLRLWREARYGQFLEVLQQAHRLYDARRSELGLLNFADLLINAAALLRSNPHVRRYFSRRFTHILVDEFQDTDPVQAEVLLLLTAVDFQEADWRRCVPRPGSLFVVGDPKQSIYRFRRADIQTYNQVKRIILSEQNGEPGLFIRLSANFRASEPMLDWVNEVFRPDKQGQHQGKSPIMLRFPAEATELSPAYVELQAGRRGVEGMLTGVYRLLLPDDAGDSNDATNYEADLIARFIRRALDSGLTVSRSREQIDDGASPEVNPSDFMIVTRTTKRLSVYSLKLQEYGIPHQVTGGTVLNEVEELDLMLTCLKAVAHPDDALALIAALRSELFGISDAALFRFKAAGGRFKYSSDLPPSLEAEDAEAFQDAFSRLLSYRRWLSELPAASAIENIIADLGLMVLASSHPGGDVQAGSLGKALELLRGLRRQAWTVGQVIEFLEGLLDTDPSRSQKYDGISACPRQAPMVRVMNLHKVKGLEAPVVFLADAYGDSPHPVNLFIDRSAEQVLGYMAVYGVPKGKAPVGDLLAHPEDWQSLSEREAAFEVAEGLRLRYVAATRAGSALIITQRDGSRNRWNAWRYFDEFLKEDNLLEDPGEQQPPSRGTDVIPSGEPEEAELEIIERISEAATPTYQLWRAKEYALARPSAHAVGPAEPPAQGEAAPQAKNAVVDPPSAGETGLEWGQVIHALLEVAMRHPEADMFSRARTFLSESDLDTDYAADAVDVVASVSRSGIWKRALASEKRLTEVPFELILQNDGTPALIRGAIDLVFPEDGGWVLVDYKTDSIKDQADVRALSIRYAPQLRQYKEAWERCTGEEVTEAGFFFTGAGQGAGLYVRVDV
jgi:ATP-dependent helicase/nuclease subunit A